MEANYFTILYWFCHTSTGIRHGCTRVPHPEPPSHILPHTIPLGHPSAPAPSILYYASNLDRRFVSHMILYMFQCHSPKSSHPFPLPQSPKGCSIHLCLFCCLAYRVIVTIFRSTLGPFSHFLFLSTLQFYMDYLCSPKSLEAGQGCVRSLQGHTRVLGDCFLFIHGCFEVLAFSVFTWFWGDDFCVALFFSSYIFIYYYWETDS